MPSPPNLPGRVPHRALPLRRVPRPGPAGAARDTPQREARRTATWPGHRSARSRRRRPWDDAVDERGGGSVARSGQQQGATGLALGVLLAWLLAAVLAAVGVAPRAQAPPVEPAPAGGPVVVVGVPGLTWDLVATDGEGGGSDPPPAVSLLAAEGGAAALGLRGTHATTCAADAWLTLGAGQRAATDVDGCVDAGPDDGATGDGTAPVLA